jgi:hypothetical protein
MLHGVLPSANTIVLPGDLHWDVTGITKSDSPRQSRRPILRRTRAEKAAYGHSRPYLIEIKDTPRRLTKRSLIAWR